MMMETGTYSETGLYMAAMAPVALSDLAKLMRDGTWVDLRTEDGPIERVRIVEIIVRVRGDDIVLRQEWLDKDDTFRKHQFAVDSESVWKAGPSRHESALGVPPYGLTLVRPKRAPYDAETNQLVVDAVHASATFLFDGDYRKGTDWGDAHHRHAAIIVIFEMTDLAPEAICRDVYNYKSPTPYITARCKLRSTHVPKETAEYVDTIRRLGKLVDDQFAPTRYRRQLFPNDYNPVLT